MAQYTTKGCKLYIGTPLDPGDEDMDATDFASITWVLVNGVENMGSIGDAAAEITSDVVTIGRTKLGKGTRRGQTPNFVALLNYADPGQIAVKAAEKTDFDYAFKIEFNDKPAAGASPKNSLRYFCGKVMSAVEAMDTANNFVKLNFNVAINSNIVPVAASAT